MSSVCRGCHTCQGQTKLDLAARCVVAVLTSSDRSLLTNLMTLNSDKAWQHHLSPSCQGVPASQTVCRQVMPELPIAVDDECNVNVQAPNVNLVVTRFDQHPRVMPVLVSWLVGQVDQACS